MNPMTPSIHSSHPHVRRPYWARAYRPFTSRDGSVTDEGDVATVSFEADAGDCPTSSSAILRSRANAPESSQAQPKQPENPVALRDIGPGSVLRGRYLIEKAIGVGGTSTVFSALDRHRCSARANGHGSEEGNRLNGFARIALKVLRAEAGASDARVYRMEREFRQMQRLTHTGIVRVFDLDCEDNLWFITMELLDGQPLHRYLRSNLKDGEALNILTQCAEALAYAHDQGIVHGDLKPGNVFVTQNGGVRLFDFGSAPGIGESVELSTSHRFAATPPYASPETLEGKGVEPRDDIFSLGCVAYELLTGGRHPFERKSSLEARQQGLRPECVESMGQEQFAAIGKALAWERAARPASAREFLQELLAAESRCETPDGVSLAWSPPTEDLGQRDTPSGEVAPESSSLADPLPSMEITEDHPGRQFAGFVPEEMLMRARQAPEPPKDLHVSGLSHGSPWIKRTVVVLLIVGALLAGFFVLGRQLPTEPAVSVVIPPVVADAYVLNGASPGGPEPIAVPEEIPPVATPPPPQPRVVARAAPGEVSFESATVKVSASQSVAVVNIARLKSTRGSAPFAWSTVGETAKAGVHYESVDSKITRFNDGQSVRSLFIPLKNNSNESSRPIRSFIVKLERTTGAPALGSITKTRVILEGDE